MEQKRKHPHQHNHMGRGLISLLLALVLCIGLCVPAFADATIGLYTISGKDFDGQPFSVTFSAASVRKATVTQIWGEDMPDDDENPIETYQVPVTILTLSPGSTITLNNMTG